MTFLSVETDAEKYAQQLATLFKECGFEVATSNHLWLQLALDGIFLCAHNTTNAPPHAIHIQNSFRAAGLRLQAFQDPKMCSDVGASANDVVFAVSNRQ